MIWKVPDSLRLLDTAYQKSYADDKYSLSFCIFLLIYFAIALLMFSSALWNNGVDLGQILFWGVLLIYLFCIKENLFAMWSNFNFFVIKKTLHNMPISFSLIIWGCVFGCVCISRSVMSNSLQPHRLWPTRLFCAWDSPGKNTAMGCHFLLQRIFPTQGSNPSLPHCRQTLYRLSHQGSPDYMVSFQFSRSVVSNSLPPHESQHARPSCPSPTPRVHSNSCPSSR